MDKMGIDGENKKLLPKLFVDSELGDQWRMDNPYSPEFTHYDRPFGKDPG